MRKVSKKQMMAEAVRRMHRIGLSEDCICDFEQKGRLSCFTADAEYMHLTDEELERIRQFEKSEEVMVYMVLRADFGYGVMDSLFYVNWYKNQWILEDGDLDWGYAQTYTINYDIPKYSGYGRIAFAKMPGKRFARCWDD